MELPPSLPLDERENFPAEAGGAPCCATSVEPRLGMLRRDAKFAPNALGTRLPFIFQVVLLLLLPLAVVYVISVLALAIELIQTALRHARIRNPAPEAGLDKGSKPHIGNFSQ